MKISTKGRYGLRILLDLTINGGPEPRLMRDIATSQQLSEKYISRLMVDLRKARLVKSIRGAKGGYILGQFPENITLLEIVETMEGRINVVDCVHAPEACPKTDQCTVTRTWAAINNQIRDVLAKVTLKEIADKHIESGAPPLLSNTASRVRA